MDKLNCMIFGFFFAYEIYAFCIDNEREERVVVGFHALTEEVAGNHADPEAAAMRWSWWREDEACS